MAEIRAVDETGKPYLINIELGFDYLSSQPDRRQFYVIVTTGKISGKNEPVDSVIINEFDPQQTFTPQINSSLVELAVGIAEKISSSSSVTSSISSESSSTSSTS